MRLVITEPLYLSNIEKDDLDYLKKCNVYCIYNKNKIKIVGQTVDLSPEYMEILFDIIEYYSENNIYLHRYESGRYQLVENQTKS